MRISVPILAAVIGFQTFGICLQNPTPSKKAARPEMREVDVQRLHFRAMATDAFNAEMDREKAGDCPNARTTYDVNGCYGKELGITDQNLKTYAGAIRDLLGLKYPGRAGQVNLPGPAGAQLTPEQKAAEFDQMEQVWRSYLDKASTAAFHQFGGGTGGPGFEMETHLRLARSHMRELNALYDMLLRL